MASVTATINVQINAANAAAQLAALQGKVANMNKGMLAATGAGVMAQEKAIKRMGNVLSGSGMFTTGIRNVHTELGRMHQEFDKGTTTLQKYRQNSRMWGKDQSNISRMAADRVRMLQSQYVALGKEMNGVQKAMQIKPDRMMREFGADTEFAHQKAVLFRRNLQMGSTALVNWGKNTQWAGRQMMVGMGIPIAIAAAGAIKSFNDIEKSSIAFKRVYGDTTTSVAEKSQMLGRVQQTVGKEMMKYGVSMADTLEMSAKAAATGAKGADLIAATRETMRLATLGDMDYNKALEATIAMQTAFGISSKDMASTTDFLNATENQTILTMQDMATAVPRVAPVIKGLGGNVKDLAVMMTALRQGGVSAEQGANALKSGLASMLNPTKTATETLGDMGINIGKIVKSNRGDLIGTVKDLGKAMDGLNKYDRQRALESLFGKYQYSRMGALLKNINSKAAKETMKMAKANRAELAKMSQQELSQISESPMIKLKAAIEEVKAAAAPLGAALSDIGAKILSFVTPVVSFFANNDIAKWGLLATAGIAALAGTFTMIVGVLANFAGSMVKAGMSVKSFFRMITGQRSLAYVTTDELEASAAANSLASAAERAAGGMMAEAKAAQLLTSQLEALIAAQTGAAATTRRPGPGGPGGVPVTPTKPGGPGAPGVIPVPPQTRVGMTQEQIALARLQRSHLGAPVKLTKDQIDKYLNSDKAIAKEASAFLLSGQAGTKEIFGKNSRTILLPEQVNADLGKGGVKASALAQQIATQGRNLTMAPLMQVMGQNLGMSVDEVGKWATSGEGAKVSSAIYNGLYGGIASMGDKVITDKTIQPMADSVINGIANNLPEAEKAALMKSGEITAVGPTGRARTLGAQWGSQYNVGPKGGLNTLLQAHAQGMYVPPDVMKSALKADQLAADDAKRAARAANKPAPPPKPISQLTKEELAARKEAALRARQERGAGIIAERRGIPKPIPTPEPTKPGLRSRYQSNLEAQRQRGSMRGMGLMGAGMLASTALMGMHMAGKEVPVAADAAVNGLIGIGMATQFFPGTMGKVSAALAAVAAGLSPVLLSIGSLAAVMGGTALAWRKLNIDARKRGADLGSALSDATAGAEDIGSAFGNTSYVVRKFAKDQGTKTDQLSAAEEFLKSDAGKQITKDFSTIASSTSTSLATSSLGAKIASWVVQGVLTGQNAKGLFAAINKQSPGLGTAVSTEAQKYLSKNYNTRDAAATSRKILASQMKTGGLGLGMMAQNAPGGPGIKDIMKLPFKMIPGFNQVIGEFGYMANKLMGRKGGPGLVESALGNQPDAISKLIQQRQSDQELVGATAGVWNASLKTAFENRLAVEARLSEMVDERDQISKKVSAGTATKDETDRLKQLNTQIKNTSASQKLFNQDIDQAWKNSQKMAASSDQETWYASQLDVARRNAKKDETGVSSYVTESIRAARDYGQIDVSQANTLFGALNTNLVSPQAIDNLGKARTGLQGVVTVLNNLPATKVQSIGQSMQQMTGPQAQAALQGFGRRFMDVARAAKLSGKETINTAKALGANKEQVKQVRVSVKADKIKDPTAGLKDKNIKVSALTAPAETRLKKLKKLAEEASGKQIKIKANSNADDVVKKLRKIIDTGKAVSGQGIHVDVDTNAPETEGKVKTLADTITGIASAGITVPLTTTGNAEGQINAAYDAGQTFAASNPTTTVTAVDHATPILASTISMIGAIQDKTVTITVNKVEKGGFTGGYFSYAYGGVHNGDGKVTGPGGPTDDKVNARLSDGEYVIKASSVNKYGTAFLSAINQGNYEKQGFKAGSPINKAPLPPKDKKGDSRQTQFMNEWRSVMYEANNFVKEFNRMKKIINHGKAVLAKQFKGMDYEFGRWIMDNYSPRQIKKMFAKKSDTGAKKLARQYQAEQKLAYRDEVHQQKLTLKNVRLRNKLLVNTGTFGQEDNATSSAIGNMSDEQLAMYRRIKGKTKKNKFLQRLIDTETAQKQQEDFINTRNRREDLSKQYSSATGATLNSLRGQIAAPWGGTLNAVQIQEYADALGMSFDDLAQQIKDGDLPANFADLGRAAKEAAKVMEVASMTQAERNSQLISNRNEMISNMQEQAGARARQAIMAGNYGARLDIPGQNSQGELEAAMALADAQNAIKQAQIDDINEKYQDQLDIFDQISQQQQIISQLEQGRLSVANALSQGDIAAAAAAAQQQRDTAANSMQQIMRNQLENQQKAQTKVIQDQINAATKLNRDIQNQIALAIAQENMDMAGRIAEQQNLNDNLMASGDWITAANEALIAQNDLLVKTNEQLDAELAKYTQIAAIAATIADVDVSNTSVVPVSQPVGGSFTKGKKKNKNKKAFGGWVSGIGNYDTEHIMATPGEFVMRKAAAARFGPALNAMNSGSIKSASELGGTSIGSIIFNINGTNLNERELGDIVVRRIQKLDSATIGSGRL